MTTPPTTYRFRGRAASRRETLLKQLALACNDGEVPLDYRHDDDGPDRGTADEKPVLPDPADRDEAYRLIAPPALMKMAGPQYTAFWRDIERLEHAHLNTCLAAFKATRDVTTPDELPGEIDGLERLLCSVGTLLARWKLANEASQGPLVGPFAAALIRGVRQRAPRPNSFGALLVPVLHVGSGDVLTALAIGHRLRSRAPLARIVSGLDLDIPKFGSGRNTKKVQLIAAQAVRRAADIPYAVHVMGALPADIADRISQAHAVAAAHLIEQQQDTDQAGSAHTES